MPCITVYSANVNTKDNVGWLDHAVDYGSQEDDAVVRLDNGIHRTSKSCLGLLEILRILTRVVMGPTRGSIFYTQ